MIKDCQFTLAAIQKTLPTGHEEFDEFKVIRDASQRRTPPSGDPSDCPFGQALELNATEGEMSRHVEVKNEMLGEVDVAKPLAHYALLVHLDISMNKIAGLHGGFEVCPNLRTLVISDNVLREITPFMFQKCKSLRSLNLDIN